MPNTMFGDFGGAENQSNQNNGMMSLLGQARASGNPDAFMMNILERNHPELKAYIANNGGDAKTAFYNMAAQQGKDPNQILSVLRAFKF